MRKSRISIRQSLRHPDLLKPYRDDLAKERSDKCWRVFKSLFDSLLLALLVITPSSPCLSCLFSVRNDLDRVHPCLISHLRYDLEEALHSIYFLVECLFYQRLSGRAGKGINVRIAVDYLFGFGQQPVKVSLSFIVFYKIQALIVLKFREISVIC